MALILYFGLRNVTVKIVTCNLLKYTNEFKIMFLLRKLVSIKLMLTVTTVITLSSVLIYWKFTLVDNDQTQMHFNYFKMKSLSENKKWSYIVDTSNCKIINVSEWNESIINFYRPPEFDDPVWPFECHKRSIRHWTYVENSNLVINETALRETGYSMQSITCCYKTITRVEQSYEAFDENADTTIKFSRQCFPMKQTTEMNHEFVRVICRPKYFPVPDGILYRQFHPIPLKKVIPSDKFKYWKNQVNDLPPNIFILGIDTLSRLNFRRGMPKTRAVLEKGGAVEMFGYTKVGENTWPNLAVLVSGYRGDTLKSICWKNITDKRHDFCPYVWRDFARANYVTAIVEDRIDISLFQFFMTGFIKKPVDFYFRPFMLGVYYHQPYAQHLKKRPKVNAMDCVGHKTVDQVMLEYNQGLANLSLPVFSFTWNTNLAHEDMTAPRNVDHLYAEFFEKEFRKPNTIFIFMSDHGSRHGPLRRTFAGWYEDKLPNLWIYLSEDLRDKYSDWQTNLMENSKKLVTAFDIHQTLLHILENTTEVKISKEFPGNSLFLPLSDRTCSEANIYSEFCPCSVPETLSVSNPALQSAATAVLEVLNNQLPEPCATLTLGKVTAGAILNKFKTESAYVVTFFAQPGDIFIEAHVKYASKTKLYDATSELTRLNKMIRNVNCIKDSRLEKFCYCP